MSDNYPPRLMGRTEAARYLSLNTSTFDAMVADGTLKPPLQLAGQMLWDKLALDRWVDKLGVDK